MASQRASLLELLGRARAAALFGLAFGLYAVLGLNYAAGIQASGDEVEYLMLTQSLWREHDLDLADNFARGDHLDYTPGLGAMPFGTFRADGRPISTHSPGLPLLLAPVYALGGRAACVLLLALMGAALTLEVWRLALRLGAGPEAAGFAWLMSAGPPVLFYSFHVYTEVPGTLLLLLALRLLLSEPGPLAAGLAALASAALPWLHVKLIPAAAALGLLAVWRLRGRARLAFVVVAAACAAAYLAFYAQVYGAPSPLALYGSKLPKKVKRSSALESLTGLFLDGSYGLLATAPVFVLGLQGLLAVRRLWNRELGALLGLGLALLLPLLVWQTWWAGHCPPARFLVPLAPLLALVAALHGQRCPTGLTRWRLALAGFGLALAIFMSASPGEHLLLNDRGEPPRVWALLAPGATRYLPLLVAADAAERRVALVWAALLAALLFLDTLARTRPALDAQFRRPWLPLGLLLLLVALVEGWARHL